MPDPSNNTDTLRTLLERLFPDVEIPDAALSSLAMQIAQMENMSGAVHRTPFIRQSLDTAASDATRMAVMFPHPIVHATDYGTDHHSE
jgi:hypothetical protein